jgi:uncharacterized protein (DUF362 family)
MEGNGPGNGDLVRVGVLLFSDDPVAVDAVGCRIMGTDLRGECVEACPTAPQCLSQDRERFPCTTAQRASGATAARSRAGTGLLS